MAREEVNLKKSEERASLKGRIDYWIFIVSPILIGVTITIIWMVLRAKQLLPPPAGEDSNFMSGGTVQLLGVFYSIIAAFVLSTVWAQFTSVEEAISTKNYAEFVKHKDKRMPFPVKLLLIVFSILLVASLILTPINNTLLGIFTIFATAFGIALTWNVINDLDDPFTGLWIVEVPESWKKELN